MAWMFSWYNPFSAFLQQIVVFITSIKQLSQYGNKYEVDFKFTKTYVAI